MHPIFVRNSAHALVTIMDLFRAGPSFDMKREDDPKAEAVEYKMMPCPISTVIGEPTERAIPWPWWKMDPFVSLLHGLQMVVGCYKSLKEIGSCREMVAVNFQIADATDQTALFKISLTGNLDMTVFDRSRVGVAHLFGSAVPRYTMIQELMAAILKVPMGVYTHVSCDLVTVSKSIPSGKAPQDAYTKGTIRQYPMIEGDVDPFIRDTAMLLSEGPVLGIQDKFIKEVVSPLWEAFTLLTQSEDAKRFGTALEVVKRCRASDWREVCEAYIHRQASDFLMESVPKTPPKLTLVN